MYLLIVKIFNCLNRSFSEAAHLFKRCAGFSQSEATEGGATAN